MSKTIYLYQHIPKCGGISFIRACKQWFPALREKVGSYPTPERIAEFARSRKTFEELEPNTFLHGHLVNEGIRPFERYGDYIDDGRFRVLTIIRDPLERWISAYFHRQRVGKEWPEPLEKWLERGKNPYAKYFQADVHNWRQQMDRFFLVGTTESMQLTTDLFARKTGNAPIETPHVNTSPRSDYQLSDALKQAFRARHALDYEIYQYAVDRLQREAAEHGLV